VTDKSIRFYVAGIHSKQPWFVLNAAKDYSLFTSQDPAISHFYSFESGAMAADTLAIPDGCVDILFDCCDTNPSAKVCGTTMTAVKANLSHGHRYFGVRFVPGMIPEFLQASATELVGHEINLLEAAPQIAPVFEQIIGQQDFRQQVAAFNDFYHGRGLRMTSDLTRSAVSAICQHKGNIQIQELEELTGYTSRTLQRNFQSDMGMSPKTFSRIIRCQSAVYDINQSKDVAFSDLACDLGFSDQSHFLREFKKLVSATPLDYLQRVHQESYLSRIRYC
tara:strand:- start:172 stop:1005 length:834 start_codon:yes stop_codon:yes gene_type:complete